MNKKCICFSNLRCWELGDNRDKKVRLLKNEFIERL